MKRGSDRRSPPRRSPDEDGTTAGLRRRDFMRLVTAGSLSTAVGARLLAACGSGGAAVPPGPDAGGARDAGGTPDAGGNADAGSEPDAGTPEPVSGRGRVALVRTTDRATGVREVVRLLGEPLPSGRVTLKPNFNSANPTPASTHPDVVRALVGLLLDAGASVTLAERSGSARTADVFADLGMDRLARELGFELVDLEALEAAGWRQLQPRGSHWRRGFPVARVFLEADAVVSTCCLKTHGFGGHFTLSLKNSVGMVARTVPGEGYDYMAELHDSPHQRAMIAEVNTAYRPAVVVLDGVDAFVSHGPDMGTLAHPGVMLASTDRVALDAVGVALLRLHGVEGEVARGEVFEQEQIARAVALGLGAASPGEIEILTEDPGASDLVGRLLEILGHPGAGAVEEAAHRPLR